MKDIGLIDVLYTAGIFFLVFYGAIAITKLFSKYLKLSPEAEEIEEEKAEDKK
ncbi:hypothetical protein [Sulfurovum sp.]|uniref:hypothetical protein n=1 Tax=Sulfurovum sp. TaxID=1969726 RepID=UPI002867CA27|nr:hypothetical protein [Sulfurovum sp.]